MKKEIERIEKNNAGELPLEKYEVFRVRGLNKPEEALEDFKKVIRVMLSNPNLEDTAEEWRELLPSNLIKVTDGFEDLDYRKDDSVASLKSLLEDIRDSDLKEWEWYSSELLEDGFNVYFTGIYRIRFYCHCRFLGIPASGISKEKSGQIYPLKLRNDVIVYKNLIAY